MSTDLKKTPLHALHQELGARLVPFAGWEMPVQYQGVSAEHEAVRTKAGVFDVSHMGELSLKGAEAFAVIDSLVTNDLRKIADGQAQYTCACNEQGTILDDLIVYRLAPEDLMIVCNASNHEKMATHFKQAAEGRCQFNDLSDDTALIAVQGPAAAKIVSQMKPGFEVNALKSFHVIRTTLLGRAATLARTGYTGEDGFEIFCANADAPALWSGLLEHGRESGISPVGLAARDTLRLEARLSLYGNEIDETTNPIEAGLSWIVRPEGRNFLGADALRAIQQTRPARALVGFEMLGRGIARHGYPLLNAAAHPVGQCTSGAPSPTLGKSIGLGYLPREMSAVGTQFLVDCRGKQISAQVVKTPFYKRAQPS